MAKFTLGDLLFERLNYLTATELGSSWNFAEHAHLGAKPGLEFTGPGLDTRTLELAFHRSFCQPEASVAKLREAADAAKAQVLLDAKGAVLGHFVVTEWTESTRAVDPEGNAILIQLRLTLKEYVEPQPLEAQRRRQAEAATSTTRPGQPAMGGSVARPAAARPAAAPARHPAAPVRRVVTRPAGFTLAPTTNADGFSVNRIVRRP